MKTTIKIEMVGFEFEVFLEDGVDFDGPGGKKIFRMIEQL